MRKMGIKSIIDRGNIPKNILQDLRIKTLLMMRAFQKVKEEKENLLAL